MTDVALVTRQGTYQVLMTTPYHAVGALVVQQLTIGGFFCAVVRGAVLPLESSVSLRAA